MKVPESDEHLYLGRLLRAAYRAFEDDVLARLHEAGFPDVRVPHITLLAWMDGDATLQSALVERAGLTAQAVSQIVEDLVAKGYLERRPVPGDRRARLIVWTERGRQARRTAHGVVESLERVYSAELGPEPYAAMRDCLGRIGRLELEGEPVAQRGGQARRAAST